MPEPETFETIEQVAAKIKGDLDVVSEKKKIALLYAFNGTGKTRLSDIFGDDSDTILSYNAFFEDLFTWNNHERVLNIDADSPIIQFITEQGIETQIIDNFQRLTASKVFPLCTFPHEVSFSFSPGDERTSYNVKISRGEESLFVWSVYFTVLDTAISILKTKEEDRETDVFNNLEYIIIDDPVSSIDDTNIITMATELIALIETVEGSNLKFLITTHHALFYNVFHNEFRGKGKKGYKVSTYLLSKNDSGLILEDHSHDSPFGYHLVVKKELEEAVRHSAIERHHFNLFRGLLEKTANFHGYKKWGECLEDEYEKEMARLINLYSHSKLSEMEAKHLPDEHKNSFKAAFANFSERFKLG